MLAAFDGDQRVPLLLGGLLVDDHAPYAVALMYRSRPPVNAREHHAVQPGIGEITIGDQARYKGFAAPRCRQCVELARTAPVAIAARKLLTCDTPSDLRRFARVLPIHVTPPSNQGMSHSG
jgi:hypothetical protein